MIKVCESDNICFYRVIDTKTQNEVFYIDSELIAGSIFRSVQHLCEQCCEKLHLFRVCQQFPINLYRVIYFPVAS